MADTKISALTALTGANTASGDVFPIVDVDANQTKKITRDEVKVALGLGTAAYTASTDYATSAQGSTADTALQPADVGTAAAEDVEFFATAAQGALADTALQLVAPASFTSRALTDSDNDKTLVCGSAQTATINTGLGSGFGCAFKGAISFDGTATVTDVRTTGATNPWCAIVNTGSNTYDVVGGKA